MAGQESRFTKIAPNGDHLPPDATADEHVAVLDSTTGLMWAAVEMPKRGSHAKCKTFCEELNLAGYADWRMPTRAELLTLVDDTRFDPAIDTDAFPGCKSDWYWTSTPYARSPSGCAWLVSFGDGLAYCSSHNYNGFVRAVRVGE